MSNEEAGVEVANNGLAINGKVLRSSLNIDDHGVRQVGNATVCISITGFHAIDTYIIIMNAEVGEVLTRNFNTIHIPNVRKGIAGRSCGDDGLTTLADRICSDKCQFRSRRIAKNIQRNRVAVAAATIIGNHIELVVGGGGGHRNRGSRGNTGTRGGIVPCIDNIAVNSTHQVCIQCNSDAITSRHSGRSNLQIGSDRGNREGNRLGRATGGILGNHIVRANGSLEAGVRTESTAIPRILGGAVSMSNEDTGVTVAENSLTKNGKRGRSSLGIDSSCRRGNRRNTTVGINGAGSNAMCANFVEVYINSAEVHARDFNAVHIPYI